MAMTGKQHPLRSGNHELLVRVDQPVMHWMNMKNHERAGNCSPARHRKVKPYNSSNRMMVALASLLTCAAVSFTESVNSTMIDSHERATAWRASDRVNGGWFFGGVPRARRCRGDGSVTYSSGREPLLGIAHRGLAAAVGSQFTEMHNE